ncbi:alpha/beta fold hydrolase [Pseudonocardia lacus]|uniref:alpha/beta fold hydrolase n=1 Tax=Pseudonocardia lacus TaxID=2835865 RepID=UPI001BDDA4F7|nr:alpha/beta hydrolase [Pseudonocardia lacus]
MNGSSPTPGTPAATTLPDGRVLAWTSWGPETGRTVLYCPGAGSSGSLGFGTDDLHDLGVRLVGIDRPGLGRSSPRPGRTLTDWCDDVAHLVADVGAGRGADTSDVRVVGFSQGAVFAAALAGAGTVRAAALVSGQDDLAAMREHLVPEVRAMVDAVADDPAEFEREVPRWAGPDLLWDLTVSTSGPVDAARYAGADFAPAYRTALAEGFAQGPAGYARDLVLALGPWPVPPEGIAVPVDLWYGALDTSTVHSPDHGRTLAERFPRGRLHLLPEEGGSLLWTRSRDVLVTLLGA